MAKLVWDLDSERSYTSGIDHVVLYKKLNNEYQTGVVWNGVTSLSEAPEGAETSSQYADNIEYVKLTSAETYGLTIEAFSSPVEFDSCDGSATLAPGITIGQQGRDAFGLSFRSYKGLGEDQKNSYELAIVYGCKASPSEMPHETINDSPEPASLSWEITSTATSEVPDGFQPTAVVRIDSATVSASALAEIEDALYGSASTEAHILTPVEVYNIVTGNTDDE